MSTQRSFTFINQHGTDGAGVPAVEHDPSDTPIDGAQNPASYTAFASSDGKFTANVWTCDAGTLQIEDLAIDEAMFIIEGEVHLTDAERRTAVFRAGDGYTQPKGFSGTMYMPYGVRKYNCIYES